MKEKTAKTLANTNINFNGGNAGIKIVNDHDSKILETKRKAAKSNGIKTWNF